MGTQQMSAVPWSDVPHSNSTDILTYSNCETVGITTEPFLPFLPWENADNIVSVQAREMALLIVRCILQEVIIFFGIPGNILCLVVFGKVSIKFVI